MATTKPRVNVTLEQNDYDVLKRLSELSGTSMSRQIAELVETVIPVLVQMADNFEKLKLADEAIKSRLRKSADDGLRIAEKMQQDALNFHSEFSDEFRAVLDGVIGLVGGEEIAGNERAGGSRRVVSCDSRPPYNNMGVRSSRDKGGQR